MTHLVPRGPHNSAGLYIGPIHGVEAERVALCGAMRGRATGWGSSNPENADCEACTSAANDALFGLDHLRILCGPICEHCWTSDGEIVPATETHCDPWGYVYARICESCANREPGDVGEDDGPITMAQRADIDARDGWRMR